MEVDKAEKTVETARDLMIALRESGTGPGKMDALREWYAVNRTATAKQLYNHALSLYRDGDHNFEGTLEKMRSLITTGKLPAFSERAPTYVEDEEVPSGWAADPLTLQDFGAEPLEPAAPPVAPVTPNDPNLGKRPGDMAVPIQPDVATDLKPLPVEPVADTPAIVETKAAEKSPKNNGNNQNRK